ncbi:MAG: AAA family ATPase [Rhodobacteraceae bacterium]|nr:AAA family ATPase [Paracoccaceae bacterium]
MRIKSIHLADYKRFTDLTIPEIPETARLVVLVGPNGSGKSSVFDSFLLKARAAVANYQLQGDTEQYYEKMETARHLGDIAARVNIDFHGSTTVDFKTAFQVRSAYRNEADFRIEHLQASRQGENGPRLTRIIDVDAAVSENYAQLAWKGMQDLFHSAPTGQTIGQYRERALGDLHDAMCKLFSSPELLLQDFGAMRSGSFRFAKGSAKDFHYKNLSGGEKAAFDILLDVFVKRVESENAVFCIDEPELHVATGLQGQLISSILSLLPDTSQLWIATHSIGIVRQAYRIYRERPKEVAFLDFSACDFDAPVTIEPSSPNRRFWASIYAITLDDLASLVAPQQIIICEGNKEKNVRGFDAQCYTGLFAEDFPDTLFVSRGSAREVIQTEHLKAILENIAEATEVVRLIDRDDMTKNERESKIAAGIRVLRRRELEEYLYDPNVLRRFLKSQGFEDDKVESVLKKREDLIARQEGPDNVKDVSQNLLAFIRKETQLPGLGNNREEFALQYLVPALQATNEVYNELREDIFGS